MDHCGIFTAKALALACRKQYGVTHAFQITPKNCAFLLPQGCEALRDQMLSLKKSFNSGTFV